MKTTITVIITIIVAIVACMLCTAMNANTEQPATCERNTYALTAKVVEIDRERDIVTCEDYNGNLWEFFGCEDWEINDCASLLMDNRGTESVHDDTITHARYSGWTLSK